MLYKLDSLDDFKFNWLTDLGEVMLILHDYVTKDSVLLISILIIMRRTKL